MVNNMEKRIKVGKITSTHGVRGEVKVYPLTDFPSRFKKGNKVYVKNGELIIEKSRPQKNMYIIKFEGFDNINDVLQFKDQFLEIDKGQLTPLEEGEYYIFDIVDCQVYDDSNNLLGVVTSVFPTGSNDVYVVKGVDKEYLIPAIEQVISSVDIENKKIVITPIEGLLE
jgi:16S rRNA processing protein RimM